MADLIPNICQFEKNHGRYSVRGRVHNCKQDGENTKCVQISGIKAAFKKVATWMGAIGTRMIR
jgi:hypothetical protein